MRFSALTLFIGISLSSSLLWAASVTQVKGNKVLINLDGMSASPGSSVYIVDSSGKKVGLATLRQVKGGKALAEITKGRAANGMTVQARSASTGSMSTEARGSSRRRGKHPVGVLLGYSMNNMSLAVQNGGGLSEDVQLKDSSFSIKGFYDYDMSPDFTIRAATGLESFSAKGTTVQSICANGASTSCEVAFNYLAFEGSAHYNFLTGKTRAWVGLGYSFLMSMSKSNNIPNLSTDSSTNQMILVSGGAEFWTSRTSFFPVVVEYGMFPGSSNVTANAIYVRGGYGLTF